MSPRLLRPRASGDPDAGRYIAAVQAADGQALEPAVRQAIEAFVRGCKQDGIWPAIKASCILMGARTLSGALTPLVGAAPTNVNFVSGDYNRKTGLVGNGSTKYLNSNRNNNADGQNDCHLAIWKSDATSGTNPYFIGSQLGASNTVNVIGQNAVFSNESTSTTTSSSIVGLHGVSRSSSTAYTYKRPSVSVTTSTISSVGQGTKNHYVFCLNNGSDSPALYSASRFGFYSIGASLDLALLNNRVTALVYGIAAAIPP